MPFCECGCGEDAGMRAEVRRGPRRFIKGHNVRVQPRALPSGEKHHNWAGDAVSYGGLHDWVRRHRPLTGACQECGTEGYTENANISGEYQRDLDDFVELCVPCHRSLDEGSALQCLV